MEVLNQEESKEFGLILADNHVHLQDYDENLLETILNEAKSNGVKYFVCNATSEKDFDQVTKIGEKYSSVVVGYGIHPWYVENVSDSWDKEIEFLLEKHPNSFVGEIGLDFHKKIPKILQKEIFERQFKMAYDFKRPVNIHCVKAHGSMVDIIEKHVGRKSSESKEDKMSILLHSYAGKQEITKRLLSLNADFFFSFSLMAARKEENFKEIPLENLVIETDSPYQINEDLLKASGHNWSFRKGNIMSSNSQNPIQDITLNEPKFLKSMLYFLSRLYNVEVEKLSEILWKNFQRAFRLIKL